MSRIIDEQTWQRLTNDVIRELADWRTQHPKATLRALEQELDTRLARLRARMLEDLAATSSAATWAHAPRAEHPVCAHCGTPLQERGTDQRQLHTHGGEQLTLARSYGSCPHCGSGLFPPR